MLQRRLEFSLESTLSMHARVAATLFEKLLSAAEQAGKTQVSAAPRQSDLWCIHKEQLHSHSGLPCVWLQDHRAMLLWECCKIP